MLKAYNIEHLNLWKGGFEKKETVGTRWDWSKKKCGIVGNHSTVQ